MSVKRGKITADKARERITILEESILAREQKLEQLHNKLSRMPEPDERLLRIESRLSSRLEVERDQLHKLKRLLTRQGQSGNLHDSAEYYGHEELDDLHRSFEEVRHDLSQVKHKLEAADIPRDLPGRLNSFEDRLSRREEADSSVFSQRLALQSSLDQERETIRKMSRRLREQEQSLEALREAVEDSVVATVDLAERLDDLEEAPDGTLIEEFEDLRSAMKTRFEELQFSVEKALLRDTPTVNSNTSELEHLMDALNDFDARLEELETRASAEHENEGMEDEHEPSSSVLFVDVVENPPVRRAPESVEPSPAEEPSGAPALDGTDPILKPAVLSSRPTPHEARVPAKFAANHSRSSPVPATFSSHPRKRSL